MNRSRFLRRTVIVCVILGSAVPVSAAPPPDPLCHACGDEFEAAAGSHNVSVTVTHSTATVSVHRNGSATWVARNTLSEAETALQQRAATRRAIAFDAIGKAELLGTTVSGRGVVTVRYRTQDVAEPAVGETLRSVAFDQSLRQQRTALMQADQLTVVAPPGMRIGRPLPQSTVSADRQRFEITQFGRGGVITFVPEDRSFGPLLSSLAVVTLLGPKLGTSIATKLLFPVAMPGLAVVAVGAGFARVRPELRARSNRATHGLAALGLLTVLFFAVSDVTILGTKDMLLTAVGLGYIVSGLVLSRPRVQSRRSFGTVACVAGAAVLIGTAIPAGEAVVVGQPSPSWSTVLSFRPLVPLFAMLPAGYAFGTGRRPLGVFTVIAGAVSAQVLSVNLLSPPYGYDMFSLLVVTVVISFVVIVGLPLFLVGFLHGEMDASQSVAQ